MKIKLSDFILENSINNADVVDIEMEQLKAQINVCCELANLYIKQMNMGVVMEAAPAQQPPTMPTKDQLQQPSSSYTQDIDSDMPEGFSTSNYGGYNYEKFKENINQYQRIDVSKLPSEINGIKITYCDNIIGRLGDSVSGLRGTGACCFSIWDVLDVDEYNRTGNGHTDKPVVHVNGYTYGVTYDPFCSGDNEWNGYIYRMADNEDKNFVQYIGSFNLSNLIKPVNHASGLDSKEVFDQALRLSETVFPMLKELSNVINNQQQQTPQQQQNPISAKTVAALAGAIIALAVFISKFLGYLNRMTNTGLNLIRIKESIDASKKYIDMMYGMALNSNFNDSDFAEFTRQFQELINLVERSIANSGNKSTDQRYVQNAQGIINSPEVKDMMSKIQQIQNVRFKQQLDSSLQNINPQNLQRFNSDFQRLKNGMTQMLESSMQEAKSTSYQQFKPAQQTQTTYQSQSQPPQGQVSQMQ